MKKRKCRSCFNSYEVPSTYPGYCSKTCFTLKNEKGTDFRKMSYDEKFSIMRKKSNKEKNKKVSADFNKKALDTFLKEGGMIKKY